MRTLNGFLSRRMQNLEHDAMVYLEERNGQDCYVLEWKDGELLGLGKTFQEAKQAVEALKRNEDISSQRYATDIFEGFFESVTPNSNKAAVIVVLPHRGGRLVVPLYVAVDAITSDASAVSNEMIGEGITFAVTKAMQTEKET